MTDYTVMSHEDLRRAHQGYVGTQDYVPLTDEWRRRLQYEWWDDPRLDSIRCAGGGTLFRSWGHLTEAEQETIKGILREIFARLVGDKHVCLDSYSMQEWYRTYPDLFDRDGSHVMTLHGLRPREEAECVDGFLQPISLVRQFKPCCSCTGLTAHSRAIIVSGAKDTGHVCQVCRNKGGVEYILYLSDDGELGTREALASLTKLLRDDERGHEARVLISQADYFKPCSRCGAFSIKECCDDCTKKVPVPGKLHGYHSTDPTLIGFFPEKTYGARYFGIEIEIFAGYRSDLIEASAKLPWFTLQRDGSLDDHCGLEIITAPHTFEAMRERFTTQGKAWREVMKAGNASGHNRKECGIHIHVSRDTLAPSTIDRLRSFMGKSTNSAFLDIVAQRVSNQYCVRSVSNERKYEALNTVPNNTVEFRLFRSNTRCDRILKNLEFVDSLIKFAESAPMYMTWKRYVRWLSLRVDAYPYLCAFLMEHRVQVDSQFLAVSRRMSLSEETDSSLLTEDFYVSDFERSAVRVNQPAGIQAGDSARYVSAHHPS